MISALLVLYEENRLFTGGVPQEVPVVLSFDALFAVSLDNGCTNSRVVGDLSQINARVTCL